jgi:hypothetical protein
VNAALALAQVVADSAEPHHPGARLERLSALLQLEQLRGRWLETAREHVLPLA